jgi:hypothetical protein
MARSVFFSGWLHKVVQRKGKGEEEASETAVPVAVPFMEGHGVSVGVAHAGDASEGEEVRLV